MENTEIYQQALETFESYSNTILEEARKIFCTGFMRGACAVLEVARENREEMTDGYGYLVDIDELEKFFKP
jgi:hypothetical protein